MLTDPICILSILCQICNDRHQVVMCMLERLVPVPLRPQRPPLVAVLGSPWVAPVGAEVDLLVGQPGFPGSNPGAPLGV